MATINTTVERKGFNFFDDAENTAIEIDHKLVMSITTWEPYKHGSSRKRREETQIEIIGHNKLVFKGTAEELINKLNK